MPRVSPEGMEVVHEFQPPLVESLAAAVEMPGKGLVSGHAVPVLLPDGVGPQHVGAEDSGGLGDVVQRPGNIIGRAQHRVGPEAAARQHGLHLRIGEVAGLRDLDVGVAQRRHPVQRLRQVLPGFHKVPEGVHLNTKLHKSHPFSEKTSS